MIDYNLLGKRLREERKKRGITQEKLSEIAEITPSYVGIIERANKIPSLSTIYKIANKTGISVDYLLNIGGDVQKENLRAKRLNALTKDLDDEQFEAILSVVEIIVTEIIGRV